MVITSAFASLPDTELRLLEQYHSREIPTHQIDAVNAAFALISYRVAGVIGANYTSVAEQSTADIEVVEVDTTGDAVDIEFRVPNGERAEMYVRSIVVEVALNGPLHNVLFGSLERRSTRGVPERSLSQSTR